jgi:hypothetical protein
MVQTEAASGEARGGPDLFVQLIISEPICLYRILLWMVSDGDDKCWVVPTIVIWEDCDERDYRADHVRRDTQAMMYRGVLVALFLKF